jgi:hypothetical protein
MAVPVELPVDTQIRGDAWAVVVNLDPDLSWSASTFAVDTVPTTVTLELDETQLGDTQPHVTLSMTAEQTATLPTGVFHWNLAESPVLGYTFLQGQVQLVRR